MLCLHTVSCAHVASEAALARLRREEFCAERDLPLRMLGLGMAPMVGFRWMLACLVSRNLVREYSTMVGSATRSSPDTGVNGFGRRIRRLLPRVGAVKSSCRQLATTSFRQKFAVRLYISTSHNTVRCNNYCIQSYLLLYGLFISA